MSDALLKRMRDARDGPRVMLGEYARLRAKVGNSLIVVVEGKTDPAFYDVMLRKVSDALKPFCLPVCGRRNVLGSIEVVRRNEQFKADWVWFFVDRDFGEAEPIVDEADLCVIDAYSVENVLVSEVVLERLLRTEYACFGAQGELDVERVLSKFEEIRGQYFDAIEDANLLVLCCRRITGGNCNPADSTARLLSLDLSGCRRVIDFTGLQTLFQVAPPPTEEQCNTAREDLRKLDPARYWRGKFHLCFFRRFLGLLKSDRESREPTLFGERARVPFSPDNNLISLLAAKADVPAEIRTFVAARLP